MLEAEKIQKAVAEIRKGALSGKAMDRVLQQAGFTKMGVLSGEAKQKVKDTEEKVVKKEDRKEKENMSKIDIRLPIMLLGGLPFNMIKGQLGENKSEADNVMLEACLNNSWIGVLRDIGTVRARLLTALSNGIVGMTYGEDNILHFTLNNPRFPSLDIDFSNSNFDEIGFDFSRVGDEPEELLKYVLYIFRTSIPHLQREWGFSDEYTEFLLNLLDVPSLVDEDARLKDLAEIYYVNRNKLPWKMFIGNSYEIWDYHYGKDGRTYFDYVGEQQTAKRASSAQSHVLESSLEASMQLVCSIIKKGAEFETKYDEKYYESSIDKVVDERIKAEDKLKSGVSYKEILEAEAENENDEVLESTEAIVSETNDKVSQAVNGAEIKAVTIAEVEEKGTTIQSNRVMTTVNKLAKSVMERAAGAKVIEASIKRGEALATPATTEATDRVSTVKEESVVEADIPVTVDEEIADVEQEVIKETNVVVPARVEEQDEHIAVKSAASAATRTFSTEERVDRRYKPTAIDEKLTSRVSYVQEKIDSSEETQKRFSEMVKGGNSIIVVDCENAKVETIWGNIFRFTTKSAMKGQGNKLWLNAKVLFVHDNDTTESADWALMINVFKKMVVAADSIEDIRVSSVKMEKAKSLTDVALGVYVGKMMGTYEQGKPKSLVILSSDSDMAGVIQAGKMIDPSIQYGVCYSEQSSGKAYRAWCKTNNICTFDAEKYDTALIERFKNLMYDYIYEERYKDIIKGAVSDMMTRQKGAVV